MADSIFVFLHRKQKRAVMTYRDSNETKGAGEQTGIRAIKVAPLCLNRSCFVRVGVLLSLGPDDTDLAAVLDKRRFHALDIADALFAQIFH